MRGYYAVTLRSRSRLSADYTDYADDEAHAADPNASHRPAAPAEQRRREEPRKRKHSTGLLLVFPWLFTPPCRREAAGDAF
jgi:hypothetical protein